MSTRTRWIVRILMVGFGLLLAAFAVAAALRSASELSVTTDESARRALQLAVVGGWLTSVGWVGLYTSLAIGFRDWPSWGRPLAASQRVPSGIRGRRRAIRQITGEEPYREDEIVPLRRLAESLVAQKRSLANWIGEISVFVLFAGFVMAPPDFGGGSTWGPIAVNVFRIVVGVTLVVLVTAAVLGWRRQAHVKAEAFLQRTSGIPMPADDEH